MSSENRWIKFQPLDRLVPPLKITLSPALLAHVPCLTDGGFDNAPFQDYS